MENFWYHNNSISSPISLSQCGYESYHSNSSVRNYIVRQKWIFHYVLSGKGFLEVDGQYFEKKEQDVFFFFKVKKLSIIQIKQNLGH